MSHSYTLYGTDHSYFTGKVRPYLRYKGIDFREKAATLWTYRRLIIPRTGVRFIPVLVTPEDEVIQDTSVIIDELERRFPERPILPATPAQRLVALLFEVYADEWFLLPGMHYRWSYREQQENYLMTEFGRMVGNWAPGPVKRAVGRRISKPFAGSLKFLGITDKTKPAIERWFEGFLRVFDAHLAQHDYLLGSRPCLGDFALAGPLYAHAWRDPASRPVIERHGPRVVEWIERINRCDQPAGDFLPDDSVPDSLLPILSQLFAEQWPVLRETADALPGWLDSHPGKPYISRALGWHEFAIGDAHERRLMFANAIWMMQRPLDHYQGLSDAERSDVDALLARCGGLDSLRDPVPRRVTRRNNRLIAA